MYPTQQSNPAKTPFTQTPIQPSTPKSSLPLILIGIVFMILIGIGSYILGLYLQKRQNQTTQNIQTTSTPSLIPTETILDKKGSEILSIDTKVNKYVNYDYGFSITYPKNGENTYSTCEERESGKTSSVPLVIFEKQSANTVYLSTDTDVEVKNKKAPEGGFTYDFSNCKVVKNSLNLIEKGYDTGIPDSLGMGDNISKPIAIAYIYEHVNNEKQLQEFALKHSPQGCEKIRIEDTKDPNTKMVRLTNKEGTNTNESCFSYTSFLYSPIKKSVILTPGYQNCGWWCEAKVEYLN